MKKFFFMLLIALLAGKAVYGQKSSVKLGLMISDALFFVNAATIETSKSVSLCGGTETEIKIVENLYQSLGIDFAPRGYNIKSDSSNYLFRISYMNLPLNIRYKFDLDQFWMAFEAGPYVGVALGGKIKSDNKIQRVIFGNREEQIKRVDYGFNLGYGIEVDRIRIRMAYNVGLCNISSSKAETLKNRSFNLSLEVRF